MNKYQIKEKVALVISLMPFNFLRVLLYRWILNYKIYASQIGFLTIIAVDEATIYKANIGKSNLFRGPYQLEIDENAIVGNKNEFICDEWVLDKQFEHVGFRRQCKLGKNTLINHYHFVDTSGLFELQENSWIGGRHSEFWTHGPGSPDTSVVIGKRCYISSAVKFAPGAKLGNNVLVGLGSVVLKKFEMDNAFIGGVPAETIKTNYDWKTRSSLKAEEVF